MQRFLLLGASAILLASCSQSPSSPSLQGGGKSSLSSIASLSSLSSAETIPLFSGTHIPVPFSPQAPSANWDPLHEEACEEMSLIMVHHFLTGTPLTPEIAEREIQDLVQWETEHGYAADVTIEELASIAEQYYGHRPTILENPTAEEFKQQLLSGHPIIIPAAGRDLGNPYFSGEGPWYHMLVITGFSWMEFITNDPGTRRGENYEYRATTLMNAIHNWTGKKEETWQGRRLGLILENKP